jgi:hypothetical protein
MILEKAMSLLYFDTNRVQPKGERNPCDESDSRDPSHKKGSNAAVGPLRSIASGILQSPKCGFFGMTLNF